MTVPLGSAHLPPDRIGAGHDPAAATSQTAPYVEEALRWLPESEDRGQKTEDSTDTAASDAPLLSPVLCPLSSEARPRVLMADDNADMRQYLARLLAGRYEVEATADGQAALAAARERLPDLILTDVMMPRLDGFGLIRELRADARTGGVPVIMLSARAGEESRVEGLDAGADDYLGKPFAARELLARVSAHLQMARLRREAGESLRVREAELREAQRVARVGSWRWDARTDATTGSEELFRIYGLDPDTQRFPDFQDQDSTLYPHDSWRRINEAVRETMRTGVGCELDVPAFRAGEPIWVTTRGEVVRDGHGTIVGLRGTIQDITDRKRAEDAVRQGEERLASELAAMSRLHALSSRLLSAADLPTALDDVLENAIAACGADYGNVQLLNRQAEALEIVAQRGFRADFLGYFRTVRVDEGSACAQAMKSGERIVIEDVTLDLTYERHLAVAAAGYRAVASTPLKTHDGIIVGMLSTHFREPHRPSERDQRLLDLHARLAADLIERLRFEQALRDADRRKDEFLATLAHELCNPLAPIRNALQITKMSERREAWEQARTMMERQVGQMVRLVDDLMDVSRITRDKLELRKEPVVLAAVVRNAAETSRPLIEQAGHELTVTLPPQPVHVEADPTRLAQVFLNLLNNSAKYTESGGRIWLTAERQGGDAVVSVRDTGIGIPREALGRVFEMFSQVDRSLERSRGGLGIGLTLVKRLVEMHGGSIEARSDGPGKGSEFVVRLPLAPAPESEGPPPVGAEPPCAAGCKVVVADDNRDAADSLALLLTIMRHEVRTVHDGQEAVAVAEAFRPEVVLLDIGMPRMNGYEACRRIREQPWGKGMMLVALTGWGQARTGGGRPRPGSTST